MDENLVSDPFDVHIIYRFMVEEERSYSFSVNVNLAHIPAIPRDAEGPFWTRLDCHQCTGCPLDKEKDCYSIAIDYGYLAQLYFLMGDLRAELKARKDSYRMMNECNLDMKETAVASTASKLGYSLMATGVNDDEELKMAMFTGGSGTVSMFFIPYDDGLLMVNLILT